MESEMVLLDINGGGIHDGGGAVGIGNGTVESKRLRHWWRWWRRWWWKVGGMSTTAEERYELMLLIYSYNLYT
ncbi:hypothetical protein MTR67_014779 [Solanum verrucosum]|uniref:Uncharacterized protein n=1 Tax=Solanum verrucosum TaxID=315347 RepID=A0AAF0QK92_SOLVR|nr:hypothetical protein MTR67_014779 [Solanum verrucosum]